MNKELSDRVWSILPKEFKEEVKRLWQSADKEQQLPHDAFLRGEYSMLVSLFGRHNLTSDEEEEEMLIISRKEVQEMYSAFEEFKDKDNTCFNLETLFGSKCLMDKEQIAENANCTEPKPSESTTFNIEHKDIVALHYDLIKLEKSVRTVRKLIDKIYKK